MWFVLRVLGCIVTKIMFVVTRSCGVYSVLRSFRLNI